MTILSKFFGTQLGWQILTYNCYEVGHTWNPSCIGASSQILGAAFKESLRIYASLYVLTTLLRTANVKKVKWKRLCSDILRSTLFLTSNAFFFLYVLCLIRRLCGCWIFLNAGFTNGFVASFISILIERKSRRGMLALYLTNLASEVAYRMLVNRNIIHPLRHGETLVFSMALSGYMFLLRANLVRQWKVYALGMPNHQLLCRNASLRSFEYFELLGQITGHLMRQGKIVCPGFSAVMQQLILGRHIEEIVTTVDDIPDIDLQRVVGKLYEGKIAQMNGSEKELVSDFLLTNPGFSTRLDGQSQSPADAKSAKTVAAAMARQAIYYDRKSEVDGFLRGLRKVCDISKSSSLMELLLHHFFPLVDDCTRSKENIVSMVDCSDIEGENNQDELALLRETVLEFIDTLSTEREAKRNTRRFLKVMTGTAYPQLSVKLRFRLVNDLEDCPVKIQACFSMANVAKNDLSKEGLLSALIDYVENEPDIYSII